MPASALASPFQAGPPGASSRLPGPGELDLCGFGAVSARPDGLPAPPAQRADSALATVARRLAAAPAEFDQATGVLLQGLLERDGALAQAYARQPGCAQAPDCLRAAQRAAGTAMASSAESLARVAASTRDPRVFRAALDACAFAGSGGTPAACAALDLRHWTQIDPDNAAPWLRIASSAIEQGQPDAADEALAQAVRHRQFEPRHLSTLGVIAQLSPIDEAERTLAVTRLLSLHRVPASQDYLPLLRHCGATGTADPGRRRLCGDLAALLIVRASTPADIAIGAALGRSAGWPQERVRGLERQAEQLFAAIRLERPSAPAMTCDWVRQVDQWISQVSRHGELASVQGHGTDQR